uniref:Uncharacterized protein n=1 Tax=Anguilla anguilla TaxID=7936 RepID=A0A0E9PRI9_ANGAN
MVPRVHILIVWHRHTQIGITKFPIFLFPLNCVWTEQ